VSKPLALKLILEAQSNAVAQRQVQAKGYDGNLVALASETIKAPARVAQSADYAPDRQDLKYDAMRETLYKYLIKDDYISSRAEKVTLRHFANIWTVNNRLIPPEVEGKYFKLSSTVSVEDSTIVKIELQPNSMRIVNVSCSCESEPLRTVKILKYPAIL